MSSTPRRIGTGLGLLVLLALVVWSTNRGVQDPGSNDAGLAWQAGQVAWNTGHPEILLSWIGTPFMALVMSFTSQVITQATFAIFMTVLNGVIVAGTAGYILWRLRTTLRPVWWWALGFAMVTFGPMLSSIWWKQFNLLSMALAFVGFSLIRKRSWAGPLLIGISVAFKPLVILLPFLLLARKETRRAGLETFAWIIVLSLAGMVMLSIEAGSLSPLNPHEALHNFSSRSYWYACDVQNYAPASSLCRLGGGTLFGSTTVQNVIAYGIVAAFGVWIIEALRGYSARAWEGFAFILPLSVMIGPISWSHYQVLLAPLFLLLLVRFSTEGASRGQWLGLVIAFALASLTWQPYGTLTGGAHSLIAGADHDRSSLTSVYGIAPFAQYVLLLTGIMWYGARNRLQRAKPVTATS